MNPQGKLKFQSVDQCLEYISQSERLIVDQLRSLILELDYPIKEKLASNVPFYYGRKRLFYIWPASIPWGGIKQGVSLGFVQGALLDDLYGLFRKSDHVKIRSIHIDKVDSIRSNLLLEYFEAAIELDQMT